MQRLVGQNINYWIEWFVIRHSPCEDYCNAETVNHSYPNSQMSAWKVKQWYSRKWKDSYKKKKAVIFLKCPWNEKWSAFKNTTKWRFPFWHICFRSKDIKTESARRWSNKWTKILYQDYLHCIANFCRALLIIFSKQFISSNTKRRKRMLNFVWNT